MAQEKSTKKADKVHDNGEAKESDAKASDTKTAPKSPGVDVESNEPNSGPGYSHSRKLSPVAPVFVPRLNQDQDPEQFIDADEENSPSVKKSTKGLSASMWA